MSQGPRQSRPESLKSVFSKMPLEVINLERGGNDLQKYLDEHDGYFSATQTADNDNTLLHVLATNTTCSESPYALRMARHIIKKYPGTMTARNGKGEVPLRAAINQPNLQWVEQILSGWEEYIDKTTLERAIAEDMAGRTGNCLHAMLRQPHKAGEAISSVYYQILETLIRNANEDSFRLLDSYGCTPLHIAVDPDLCTEKQVEIVRTLLEHYDGASNADLADKDWESPYLFHQRKMGDIRSFRNYRAGYSDQYPAPANTVPDRELRDEFEALKNKSDGKMTMMEEFNPSLRGGMRQEQAFYPRSPPSQAPLTHIHAARKGDQSYAQGIRAIEVVNNYERVPKSAPSRLPTQSIKINTAANTSSRRSNASSVSGRQDMEPGEDSQFFTPSFGWVEEVYQVLQQHYLWTKTPSQALRILYGDNPDSETFSYITQSARKRH